MIKTLKSNSFALWVAIASVLVQLPHSYHVFASLSKIPGVWGIVQAALFSIVIDMALIFYTLRNRRDISLFFAAIMVLINGIYYFDMIGFSARFAAAVIISFVIPVSVYFYSEEIKEEELTNMDLKKMRDSGLSYKAIGEAVGLNPGTVHKRLNGKPKSKQPS